jgi:hypothetical protein
VAPKLSDRDHMLRPAVRTNSKCNGGQKDFRRKPREPDIGWTYTPRLPPGEYPAISRTAARYFDKVYKRWVCVVHFDVFDDPVRIECRGRLTWFLNLGSGLNPRAGRRSNFWAAWTKANGGSPKRGDRLSLRVFLRRAARVRVEDTEKSHSGEHVESDQAYSVVRDVIEWETGGGSR